METHVIGVSDGGGDSTVILQRPGKHVLVLSAREATTWHLDIAPGATLAHVYAVGVHHQKVVTTSGADIKTESADDGGVGANGYAWPDTSTDQLLKLAAIRTHHNVNSFHGCYFATQWTIGEDMGVVSDCHTEMGYQQFDAVTRCDSGDDGTCGGGGSGGSGSGGSGSDSGGDGSLY